MNKTPKILWHFKFWIDWFKAKFSLKNAPFDKQVLDSYSQEMVNYYCKLMRQEVDLKDTLTTVSLLRKTGYSYDLFRILQGFPKYLRFNYLWGDIIHVPTTPTFVKSRPISGNNANSVLLPLDSHRHFRFVKDPYAYEEKKSMAVWRGAIYQDHRRQFFEKVSPLDFCDVADTNRHDLKKHPERWMSIEDQLQYKIIFSIEGNDVATNLKWIMSSNSLCFSPKLIYETWFREGQLQAFVHYVEIRDDFSDVEEKFEYYMAHPEEAQRIIANSQAYAAQFINESQRFGLAKHVAWKYFEMTNQLKF